MGNQRMGGLSVVDARVSFRLSGHVSKGHDGLRGRGTKGHHRCTVMIYILHKKKRKVGQQPVLARSWRSR
jgi:hypothetical protein